MARTKAQKKEIIEKVQTLMDDAKSLVFVNIHGLKLENAIKMRRALKADKVGFFVAKKSLTSLALANKKYEGTAPELLGEFGFAYGTDLVAPARGVYEFQKKLKGMPSATTGGQVTIIGGVFENKYMTKDEMVAIASIPPFATLQGMFLQCLNSPIQGFVMALDQIAQKKTV